MHEVLPPAINEMRLSCLDALNQPIAKVVWPRSPRKLQFGYRFTQSRVGVVWPSSLQMVEVHGSDWVTTWNCSGRQHNREGTRADIQLLCASHQSPRYDIRTFCGVETDTWYSVCCFA
ncbi:unnamed protein product [Ectocarpus sp. 4 AP-2014]